MSARSTSWKITAFFLCQGLFALSQDVRVSALLDSASIRIGEQTKLHLSVQYSADKKNTGIQWPALADTIIDKIQIVSISKTDTSRPYKNNPATMVLSRAITITCFDSGYYAIPPFRFIINSDTAHPYETEAVLLQVNNVRFDPKGDIKDIKNPYSAPFSWKELLPYFYWALAIIAAVLLIIWLTKKFSGKKVSAVTEKKPGVPPHVLALEELEKLRSEHLWQENKFKQYHSRISDILRFYIESRFKIPAMEQTSDEIMSSMRSVVIAPESKAKLKQVLLLSDLVKFAKEEPLPNENELSLSIAVEFVKGTSREEPAENAESSKHV